MMEVIKHPKAETEMKKAAKQVGKPTSHNMNIWIVYLIPYFLFFFFGVCVRARCFFGMKWAKFLNRERNMDK